MFKLGRAYKALLDELRLGGNVFIMNPIDPESLIYRFAKQLEFGSSMMQVASEAVRIVQRMNRDWMITGRRPAGICGAALILAARMNNFRRTIREVVYVVKVTELTIHQRLKEFKATESGDLTVDQFRSVQLENAHDPPAFTQGKRLKQAMKQKNASTEIANGDEDENARQLTTTSSAPRTMRVDADGFAIPDVPIDPALLADKDGGVPPGPSTTKAKRGRPKGAKNFRPPPPTASELASESALESEMQELLTTGTNLLASTNCTTSHTAPTAQCTATPQPPKPIPSTPDIDASEFDSDPEVKYCLLSPAEVEIKERIWVHENKDYLRMQQAKALKRALAAEEDLMNGRVPGSGMGRRPRKRRKGRMGDVGYLDGKEGGGEESMDGGGGAMGTRASTPAEATRRMLEQRGFSKKINYRLLEEMYEDGDERKAVERRGNSESGEGEGGNGGWRRSRRSASVSSVRSSIVVSDRSAAAAAAASGAGLGIRGPVRERVVKGSRSGSSVPAFVSAVPTIPSPAPAPAPTSSSTQPQPTATTLGEEAEAATPTPPSTNPHEEILGYIPGPERGEEDADVDGEDTDDDEEDVVEDDHVDEAFAGNYYGGASDDDDDYYF